MIITIKLRTDNDAFEHGNRDTELLRILSEYLAAVPRYGWDSRNLRDINGNTVGSVKVTGR